MRIVNFVELSNSEKEQLETVRQCTIDRKRVIIDYESVSSEDGRRTIVPFSLRQSKAGNTLLLGWNVLEGTRAYRVDRINHIEASVDPWPENIPWEEEIV